MNKKTTIKFSDKKGFSLIEMLIVITIVGIGLIGMVSFFNINLSSQYEVKNEVVAAGLAQEGVELMRSARDYQLGGGGKSWSELASDWTNVSGPCVAIDHWSTGFRTCYRATGTSGALYTADTKVCRNNTREFYQQCSTSINGSTAYATNEISTDMTRSINVQTNVIVGCPTCLKVVCTVAWNGRKTEAVDIFYPNSY